MKKRKKKLPKDEALRLRERVYELARIYLKCSESEARQVGRNAVTDIEAHLNLGY